MCCVFYVDLEIIVNLFLRVRKQELCIVVYAVVFRYTLQELLCGNREIILSTLTIPILNVLVFEQEVYKALIVVN